MLTADGPLVGEHSHLFYVHIFDLPRELSHVGETRPLHYKLWELVRYILPAGCYAFGGPTVHLAVFHNLFVTKLHWLHDQVRVLQLWMNTEPLKMLSRNASISLCILLLFSLPSTAYRSLWISWPWA
jgi:hypothetical protein